MMSEKSYFWDGEILGDAVEAPYDAPNEFARLMKILGYGDGVCKDIANELAISGTSNPVTVAPGAAMVHGTAYFNDDYEEFSVSTPIEPRTDIIVLRKDWVTQTVRLAVKEGTTELTKIEGDVWEILLAELDVDDQGNIVITDKRAFVPNIMHIHGENGVPLISTNSLINNILSADASGRNKIQDGFFNEDARVKFVEGFVNSQLIENNTLTHSKIVDRDRVFLVEPMYARNTTDSKDIYWGGTDTPGYQIPNSKNSTAYGTFQVPTGCLGSIKISAAIHPQASGNCYCKIIIEGGRVGYAWPEIAIDEGYGTVGVSNDILTKVNEKIISEIDDTYFFQLRWQRNATNALDTAEGVIGFLGWCIEYTADM